mgnify:CR=1 FL=1
MSLIITAKTVFLNSDIRGGSNYLVVISNFSIKQSKSLGEWILQMLLKLSVIAYGGQKELNQALSKNLSI